MEQKYPLKTIFIISLLIFSLCCVPLQTKAETENPYGKNNWKLGDVTLSVISGDEDNLEANNVITVEGNLTINIVDEDKEWATVYVNITNINASDEQSIDNTELLFKVYKSNNLAYNHDTKVGFFPFYLFEYNNPSILDGDWEKEIVVDEKYTINYRTGYEIKFSGGPYLDKKTMSIDEPVLQYSSKRKISYLYNTSIITRKMTQKRLEIGAKGTYPLMIKTYLPASLFIDNVTDERYVRIEAGLGRDQDDAVEYLNSLDIQKKKTKDDGFDDIFGLGVIAGIIGLGSIVGYLAYRRKR